MTRLPWCTAFIVAAALTPAAQQNPIVRPGIRTPQPTAPPQDRAAAPATGTARIRGRVVAPDTGAPLRGAQIMLSGETLFLRRATADDDGRYEFVELPAGRFYLSASRGGYVTLQYGGTWPPATSTASDPGRPLSLVAAQVLNDVDFALPRGGVITGRIIDEFGEPVTGVQVRVERYRYGPGGRQLAGFSFGEALSPFTLTTNDLGEFRVFGLMPGDYVVSAHLRSMALTSGRDGARDAADGFLPTYYPGTANVAEARTIRVGASREVAADFAMVPGRMLRISGTAVDSMGRPATGLSVFLATETATTSGQASGGPVGADGSFSIGNVPPGDYVLRVRPQGGGGPATEVASLPISATADLTGLRLTTRPGTTIRGRLEWEGSAPRPTANLRVTTTSAEWPRRGPLGESTFTYLDLESGTVREDDTFELGGIIGAVSFRVGGLTPQWTVKTVMGDGKDIIDTGADAASLGGDTRVRVVLTDRITDLSGSVKDARGQSVSNCVVVLLPEQEMDGGSGIRFTRTVRPDQNGSFRFRALPPGRYVAAAVEGLDQGSEWNPVFQKTVRAAGESFTLTEGQTLTLDLGLLR